LSDGQKKEIYQDVRFFHGAIQLLHFITISHAKMHITRGRSSVLVSPPLQILGGTCLQQLSRMVWSGKGRRCW